MSQPIAKVGAYKNLTDTSAVTSGPCQLIGYYVNSQAGSGLTLRDGGASGTLISTFNPSGATFYPCPANVSTSLHATKNFGTWNITFFFAAGN